jgi:hypothetical protein
MSNEKDGEKPFGRKPKGSNMKSISSWVRTVPNGKLKGVARWEIEKIEDPTITMKNGRFRKRLEWEKRNSLHVERMNPLHPGKNRREEDRTRNRHRWVGAECTKA